MDLEAESIVRIDWQCLQTLPILAISYWKLRKK